MRRKRAGGGIVAVASAGAASFGTGTTSHLVGEWFKMMAGVDMVHVPYRGSGPVVTDLLGGQVQCAFDNLPGSIEQIRAGKLRPLAVSTATRSESRVVANIVSELPNA